MMSLLDGFGDPWLDAMMIRDGGEVPPPEWWKTTFEHGPGKLQGETYPRITAYLYVADQSSEMLSTSDEPMGYIAVYDGALPWSQDEIWTIRESESGFLTATMMTKEGLVALRKEIDRVAPRCDTCGAILDDGVCWQRAYHNEVPDDSPSIEDSVPFEELALRAEIRTQPEPRFIPAEELSTILAHEVDHQQLVEHLVEIYRALWPTHDHSWSPDTTAAVAETFTSRGYGA